MKNVIRIGFQGRTKHEQGPLYWSEREREREREREVREKHLVEIKEISIETCLYKCGTYHLIQIEN